MLPRHDHLGASWAHIFMELLVRAGLPWQTAFSIAMGFAAMIFATMRATK